MLTTLATLALLTGLLVLLRGSLGQAVIESLGRSILLTADGRPEMKTVGGTIDWSTVTAVTGADVTWLDGVVIKIGEKGLRYGQVMCKITASGKYGPYDFAAADGRQTCAPGDCFILNRSIREDEAMSDHAGGWVEGGKVFKSRLLATAGTHSLANGPTYTELLAAMPRLRLHND